MGCSLCHLQAEKVLPWLCGSSDSFKGRYWLTVQQEQNSHLLAYCTLNFLFLLLLDVIAFPSFDSLKSNIF